MTRETVGKIASELAQKTPETRDPIELQREMQQDYLDNLIECIKSHIHQLEGDFFVVVDTKRERLMENVFRNYFYARKTCPTPNYDQSVFKFIRDSQELEYIWTVPDRETAHILQENALQVAPEEKDLLNFVLQFADGTLYRLCKTMNGEEIESPLLIKG